MARSQAVSTAQVASSPSANNPIINGAFDIWQRGTSFSVAASTGFAYYADRWGADTDTNQACTFSRQATGDTTNLPNIQYCFRFQRNSGQTGTGTIGLSSSLESANSIPLAGRTVTLSFYARAGANYSPTSSALVYRLITGTGTDQNAMSGYTGSANTINSTATLTTTWQRFSATATMPTNATEAAVYFRYTPTGTAGAADYFEITGVQIDIGSVALPFRRSGNTIQGELAACQRYYWKTQNASAFVSHGSGFVGSSTAAYIHVVNPVAMRVAATSLGYNNVRILDGTLTSFSASAISLIQGSSTSSYLEATITGATSSRPALLTNDNSTSGYIALSAEL